MIHFDDDIAAKNKTLEFVIGRDNNVNIRITDISVSRNHSKITYFDNNFYVQDYQSKFGTLILLQAPFPIPYHPNWDLTLQVGRYLGKLCVL